MAKIQKDVTSTTDGSTRRSMFSYVTGEKGNWYCLFGKQYEKKIFLNHVLQPSDPTHKNLSHGNKRVHSYIGIYEGVSCCNICSGQRTKESPSRGECPNQNTSFHEVKMLP